MAQTVSEQGATDWKLTDVVHRVFQRHMLRHTGHDIHSLVFSEELPTQLGVIANEDAWIQLALVQAVPRVFK